jgi:hypothetical protein
MVDKPKAREIHAAHYSDRVVHHWLVPGLEALYEPVFIHDVYSNRKDKGTHKAVKRLQHFMRGVSRAGEAVETSWSSWFPCAAWETIRACVAGPREKARLGYEEETGCDASGLHSHAAHGDEVHGRNGNEWNVVGARPCGRTVRNPAVGFFLQLDIKNFFNSVDRRILFSLLQTRLRKAVRQGEISESEAVSSRDISHIILKQDVGKEAFMAATPKELARIPAYKRLINAGPDKGLPIGNLTSQFFANVYLNELDQFIKHELKCRYYLRFVDDFILLHRDPEQLRCWHREIENFLMEKLGLELKQPVILQPVRQGANFLGYIVRPDYLLVRQRVVGNLWEKLFAFEKQWIKGDDRLGWVLTLLPEPREHLRSVLASYWGHFSHACHYRLAHRIFTRFPWLTCLFELRNDRFVPLWQPSEVSSYKSQQRYFQRQFPGAEIRIQRGCQFDKVAGVSGYPGSHAPVSPHLPGSHAPHGNPSAPALQARMSYEQAAGMNQKRDAMSPKGISFGAHPGCIPMRRMGTRTKRENEENVRFAVSKVIVRQQGYLKGGLRRRCIESITFLPSSSTGVSLCASFAP